MVECNILLYHKSHPLLMVERKFYFPLLKLLTAKIVLPYDSVVAWCGVGSSDIERLERVQRAAARLIAKGSVTGRLPRDLLLARAGLEPLQQRRRLHCGVFAYDLTFTSRRRVPLHLAHLFEHWQARVPTSTSALVLRSAASGRYRLPRPRTELFHRSPLYYCLSVLNTVPSDHLSSLSLLKSFLLGFS